MVRSTGNTDSVKMRYAFLASATLTLIHPTATKESGARDLLRLLRCLGRVINSGVTIAFASHAFLTASNPVNYLHHQVLQPRSFILCEVMPRFSLMVTRLAHETAHDTAAQQEHSEPRTYWISMAQRLPFTGLGEIAIL